MENVTETDNFKMKIKIAIVIGVTVIVVLILFLSYIGIEVLANTVISITASSIGICGGYCVSNELEMNKKKKEAIRLKNNMLKLLKNEIRVNGVIFNKHYDNEKVKSGSLDLKQKKEFKVDVWHKLEFKIFGEGIEILDENRFTELCELYRRFEILNLQKELNSSVNEASKKDILNYIYNDLMKIETYLRAN